MKTATHAASGAQSWPVEGEITIYRAAELKPALLSAVAASQLLEIDLSRVTEFDTAGLQLLMLAKRQAQALGHELRLVHHSEPVIDVIELLDLAAYFGDPLLVASS